MSWFDFSGKKKLQELEEAEKRQPQQFDEAAVVERIRALTIQHISTLAPKWNQVIYQDEDGNYLMDKWLRDFNFFFDILRKDELIASYHYDFRKLPIIIGRAIEDYKKELEPSKPIEVIRAAYIAGNEIVITLNPPGDFAAVLYNLEPEPLVPPEDYALQCCWQFSILIGEGKAARSVMLDLPPFIYESQYERSRKHPVFVANNQPSNGTDNGRLIYYRDTLFWLSRPWKDEDFEVVFNRAWEIVQDEFLLPVNQLVNQHIATLARKWDQTIYQDDYGNYLFDRWRREYDYFFDNVLRKDKLIAASLTSPKSELWAKKIAHENVMDAITEYQTAQLKSNSHLSVNVDDLDPVEFEHYCADMLRSGGWDVRVTQASGDQGIDLIANRGNVKAVFQCKKYSQPVGNGAVQEIIAGKQFEQAHIAAVVSNSTYTQSAKQLANTTGVHLLHFTELERFAEMAGVA